MKTKRRPGEKQTRNNGQFKLPRFPGLRTPDPRSPLYEFLASLNGEIPLHEAIKEFQDEWCKHPRQARVLLTTIALPYQERFEYEWGCSECGVIKTRKGRPPSWMK